MTTAPTLWEQPTARATDPATSHKAATRARRQTHEQLALKVLRENPSGLTDHELATHTGVPQTSIGVRRKSLERQGLVVATQKRRPSPSGSMCIVWAVVS